MVFSTLSTFVVLDHWYLMAKILRIRNTRMLA